MTKFTFTRKAWDDIRPASVKDNGLGAAIDKLFKLVPGGDTAAMKDLGDFFDARKQLGVVGDLISDAAAGVGKAKDDKKDAGKLLKKWTGDVKDGYDGLDDQELALFTAVVGPVVKEGVPALKQCIDKVADECMEFSKADSNLQYSIKLQQEAIMAIVKRAGELREQAHPGETPDAFMDDGEFKSGYKFWEDQIAARIKASQRWEAVADRREALVKSIKQLQAMIADASKQVDKYSGSPALKDFVKLAKDARQFNADLQTKYEAWFYMRTIDTPSSGIGKECEQELARQFKGLTKVDAETYLDRELGKRGLDPKQFKKITTDVKDKIKEVKRLIPEIENETDPSAAKIKVDRLVDLSAYFDANYQKFRIARADGEVAQYLSFNDDRRKEIDESLKFFAACVAVTVDAATTAQKNMKGARRT